MPADRRRFGPQAIRTDEQCVELHRRPRLIRGQYREPCYEQQLLHLGEQSLFSADARYGFDFDVQHLRQQLEASRDYLFAAAGIPQNLFSSQ